MSGNRYIYFDHAAATPVDSRVAKVMQPFFSEEFFNPSSLYAPAVMVRKAVDDAKHKIAINIGANKDDCIITAGATESINLAMTASQGGSVITSAIEHPAVLESAKQYPYSIAGVGANGIIDLQSISRLITPETQLVSVGLANHELGTIQPLSEIAELVSKERLRRRQSGDNRPIWLHADASQGVGQLDISVNRLGVDLLTINSGKIYGPKQVGLLWRRAGVELKPIIFGGGQEMGLRSGTENVAGAIGFAEALDIANKHRKSERKRLSDLREVMRKILFGSLGDKVEEIGDKKRRLSSHMMLAFSGIDAERLVYLLEAKDILVSTGSACSASSDQGSKVLQAIGLQEGFVRGSLRISLGRTNTQDDIITATKEIVVAVEAEYRRLEK
ncbi:aminotransferase [Candidatus Saccharibacteria bacterium]|nr:MAG: aminotransferase [Candidatus Saccharibacteria bacterium]